MKSFILVSFGVLGWVFFELSGGMGFQTPVDPALASASASTQVIANAPVAEAVEITTIALRTATTTEVALSQGAAEVASVITSVSDPELSPVTDIEETPPITLISLEQSGDQVGGSLDGFDPDAIRVSAFAPEDATEPEPAAFVEPELPPIDLRTIKGTRVNMRNGPGTTYGIITRLTLGDEVEVLDGSGSWLRLRLVSDQTVGWISASLVSKKSR